MFKIVQQVVIMLMAMTVSLSFEASAQPTADDNEAFCQSETWEELTNDIRADIKTSCQSTGAMLDQTQQTASDVQEIKDDLGLVKDLLELGLRQQEDIGSARDVEQMKEDLTEVKNLLRSHQREENETSRAVTEEMAGVKILLGSWQPEENQTTREANLIIEGLAEIGLSVVIRSCPQQPCKAGAIDSSILSVNCIPLLVQQNVNGSNAFNRSWAEFKVGFNDSRGNYWLGNDRLHQLTTSGHYKLRFDLQERSNGSWYYAEYSSFIVYNETSKYQMQVSRYSGNAGGYGFLWHNGKMFSTYDRDDEYCAVYNGGGFWHRNCARASVNTVRGRGNDFRWWSESGKNFLLQTSRMWLTC